MREIALKAREWPENHAHAAFFQFSPNSKWPIWQFLKIHDNPYFSTTITNF